MMDAGDTDTDIYSLVGTPMLFSPTAHGFGLSVVLERGDPMSISLQIRGVREAIWSDPIAPSISAAS